MTLIVLSAVLISRIAEGTQRTQQSQQRAVPRWVTHNTFIHIHSEGLSSFLPFSLSLPPSLSSPFLPSFLFLSHFLQHMSLTCCAVKAFSELVPLSLRLNSNEKGQRPLVSLAHFMVI